MRYLNTPTVVGLSVATLVALAGVGCQSREEPKTAGAGQSLRTAWNEPDLQGLWSRQIVTPLERPARYKDRAFLTDQEVAEIETVSMASPVGRGRDVRAVEGTEEDVEGAYNNVFTGSGGNWVKSKRTSLIIDPPDGRLPPLTADGEKNRGSAARRVRRDTAEEELEVQRRQAKLFPSSSIGAPGSYGPGGVPYSIATGTRSDDPEDRNDIERCRGFMLPWMGGIAAYAQIVQSPGSVTIYYEQNHGGGAYRTIPIGTRPHVSSTTRLWLGDSVARWEGDTLVVDTTNFTDQTAYLGSSDETLHVTERYTRTAADDLQYQVTIDKPAVFTRPWTMEVILLRQNAKENKIYESACHEGNYAMVSMLAGARIQDRGRHAPLDK